MKVAIHMQDNLPKRKNTRLKNYDYSQEGAYFITICTQGKRPLFGKITVGADLVSARVELTAAGQMIERVYAETIAAFSDIISDKHIVMPNHFHCIVSIQRADTRFAPTVAGSNEQTLKSISSFIQALKSKTTVEYVRGVKEGLFLPFNKRIWQTRFHDHIIRDEASYLRIWKYIDENPLNWQEDCYFVGE